MSLTTDSNRPADKRPGHYRTADLALAVVFLLAGIFGGYMAMAEGVRDYWLLLIVGVVGTVLLWRRAMRG